MLRPHLLSVAAVLGLLVAAPMAMAQEGQDPHDEHPTFHGEDHHYRNVLAVFVGHTREHFESNDTYHGGFTFGLEYCRIVASRWCVGGLVERAGGEIRGTLVLAQVFFNPVGGLLIATGPGVEFVDARGRDSDHGHGHGGPGGARADEEVGAHTEFVYRVGLLYEFKLDRFVIAPTIDLDFVGRNEALVLGANFGYEF